MIASLSQGGIAPQFADFNCADLLQAATLIWKSLNEHTQAAAQVAQTEPESVDAKAAKVGPSENLASLEILLTSMVADESQWATSWSIMLWYVIKNKRMPNCLNALNLDVPPKFRYMLSSDHSAEAGGVKAEESKDSKGAADSAGNGRKRALDGGDAQDSDSIDARKLGSFSRYIFEVILFNVGLARPVKNCVFLLFPDSVEHFEL